MKRAVSEKIPNAFEQLTAGSVLTLGKFAEPPSSF
jgi:hypothetical protein